MSVVDVSGPDSGECIEVPRPQYHIAQQGYIHYRPYEQDDNWTNQINAEAERVKQRIQADSQYQIHAIQRETQDRIQRDNEETAKIIEAIRKSTEDKRKEILDDMPDPPMKTARVVIIDDSINDSKLAICYNQTVDGNVHHSTDDLSDCQYNEELNDHEVNVVRGEAVISQIEEPTKPLPRGFWDYVLFHIQKCWNWDSWKVFPS